MTLHNRTFFSLASWQHSSISKLKERFVVLQSLAQTPHDSKLTKYTLFRTPSLISYVGHRFFKGRLYISTRYRLYRQVPKAHRHMMRVAELGVHGLTTTHRALQTGSPSVPLLFKLHSFADLPSHWCRCWSVTQATASCLCFLTLIGQASLWTVVKAQSGAGKAKCSHLPTAVKLTWPVRPASRCVHGLFSHLNPHSLILTPHYCVPLSKGDFQQPFL